MLGFDHSASKPKTSSGESRIITGHVGDFHPQLCPKSQKGGRISSTAAFAGGVLSIKPVVGVIDGAVEVLGKARGSKNAENALFTKIYECGGVDFSMPYRVGYTGISDDVIKKYIKDSSELWDKYVDDIQYQTVGSAIGTHVGPGALACAFFPKHPERLNK